MANGRGECGGECEGGGIHVLQTRSISLSPGLSRGRLLSSETMAADASIFGISRQRPRDEPGDACSRIVCKMFALQTRVFSVACKINAKRFRARPNRVYVATVASPEVQSTHVAGLGTGSARARSPRGVRLDGKPGAWAGCERRRESGNRWRDRSMARAARTELVLDISSLQVRARRDWRHEPCVGSSDRRPRGQ